MELYCITAETVKWQNTSENLQFLLNITMFLIWLATLIIGILRNNKFIRIHEEEFPWQFDSEWHQMEQAQMCINRKIDKLWYSNSKIPLPKTQDMTLQMDITRCSIPKSDWLYSLQLKMKKLYTVSKNKTGSWLWLRSWTSYCNIQT